MASVDKRGEPLPHTFVPLAWWKNDTGRWQSKLTGDYQTVFLYTACTEQSSVGPVRVLEIVRRTIELHEGGRPSGTGYFTAAEFDSKLQNAYMDVYERTQRKPTQGEVAACLSISTATFSRYLQQHRTENRRDPFRS